MHKAGNKRHGVYQEVTLSVRLLVVSFLIVAGMFMTLLDTTIVDIVLPHMMSSFEAKPDDIQWVIIAYMIASAVAMPTVGWLGGLLGHRNTYLLGIALFTVMSAVCGLSPNLETMVAGRTLQGVGEGIAVPMTMTLLFELYPPERRGLAMGMFALGATFGPSLGPTLGGYLSEHLNWRWVFYVNLLPGVLVVYLLALLMENEKEEVHRRLDVPGFLILAVSLSCLITALSKGNDWGWKDERTVLLLYVAVAGAFFFVYRELSSGKTLVNLELFRYPFFAYPVLSLTLFGMGVYASYFLLPLYLEHLRGFPTLTAGELLFFPAMATGVVSLVAGFLIDRGILSLRSSVFVGVLMFTWGTYLQTGFDLDMSKVSIVLSLLPWGAGMGFFFPALSQISLGNFKGELLRQASALQNLLRLVGGSVGTAISTYIFMSSQSKHMVSITQRLSAFSPQVLEFTGALKAHLYHAHSVHSPLLDERARALLAGVYLKHAYWHAFADAFFFATVCGLMTLLPVVFMGRAWEVRT